MKVSSGWGLFSSFRVMLYGYFPTPGPPRSDLEDLLCRGGAVLMRDWNAMLESLQGGGKNKLVIDPFF